MSGDPTAQVPFDGKSFTEEQLGEAVQKLWEIALRDTVREMFAAGVRKHAGPNPAQHMEEARSVIERRWAPACKKMVEFWDLWGPQERWNASMELYQIAGQVAVCGAVAVMEVGNVLAGLHAQQTGESEPPKDGPS